MRESHSIRLFRNFTSFPVLAKLSWRPKKPRAALTRVSDFCQPVLAPGPPPDLVLVAPEGRSGAVSQLSSRTRQRWRELNFNGALALGTVALSLIIFALIPSQIERPPMLFGQSEGPLTPAFFPTLVATSLLVLGLLYLWQSPRLKEINGFRELTRTAYWNVAVTMALLVLYSLILVPLGFLLASGIVMALLSLFLGARHWPSIALVAIGLPIAIYAVFRYGLSVGLPEFQGL